jgi:hypothetical protein
MKIGLQINRDTCRRKPGDLSPQRFVTLLSTATL